MCNSVEDRLRAAVLELAKVLHEAAREAVMKNLVVRRDVPNNGFIEWDQLDDAAREGRIIQARYILNIYAMLPLDNTRACSGCRMLTNALNDMDESRRQLIQHREALAALVGASEPDELSRMRDFIACAPVEDPQDKAHMVAAIELLMQPINAAPAVTSAQEVPLDTP